MLTPLPTNKGSLSEEELDNLEFRGNGHPLLLSCPIELDIETNRVLNRYGGERRAVVKAWRSLGGRTRHQLARP